MNVIEMEGVEKSYGNFTVLEDYCLKVPEGNIFCLLGPNGSGKTTTINMINGLLKPTKGKVKVFNYNPQQETNKIRSLLAVVPQETALYNDLSGRENLSFHGKYYGVSKKNLSDRIDKFLELVGLEKRQHDRVGNYSGGMQRRLALARALLTDPELILLDEPTLGVDVQSRNAIWDQVKELRDEGKTIFLTTNYMEEAEALADIIKIIDQGKEVVSGSPEELKDKIHDNTLILEVEDKAVIKQISNKLFDSFDLNIDGKRISIPLNERKDSIMIMSHLEDEAKYITRFTMKEPGLNDVFLYYTGHELRD